MGFLGLGRRKKKTVVVASRQAGAILRRLRDREVRINEALTTSGVYDSIGKASLVILSVEDLVETDISKEVLTEALEKASVRTLSPQEFLRDPQAHLERLESSRGVRRLPPLRVAFTSLSGGVGCTTLAYGLAQHAARRRQATVALVELTWGNGALGARLNLDGAPDLYQVVSELGDPARRDGMSVVPIRQETARLLLGNLDGVAGALDALAREHVLLSLDAHAAHPLWTTAREIVDRVLVVTDQRPDAVENAKLLLAEMEGSGLVVNKATLQDRVALGLAGQEACLIPRGANADDAGRRLIEYLYD